MCFRGFYCFFILGISTVSFGQRCLEFYQLERMLNRNVSYSEVNNFLVENNFYERSSGLTSLVLGEDSIKTNYFRNSGYDDFVSIHNQSGATHRIVEYSSKSCSYLIVPSLLDNGYVLVSDSGIQEYRKGSINVLIDPSGLIVLYGKEIADLRAGIKKSRIQQQELKARVESDFLESMAQFRTKLVTIKSSPDSSGYFDLYTLVERSIRSEFRSRSEVLKFKSDILSDWKSYLVAQVDSFVGVSKFERAERFVKESNYPVADVKDELLGVVFTKRLEIEIQLLAVQLDRAIVDKNYVIQLNLSERILAHPRATQEQVAKAKLAKKKAEEMLSLISQRKGLPLVYWEQKGEVREQVEDLINDYLVQKIQKRRKGSFELKLSVVYDTLGVNKSQFEISDDDKELGTAIMNLLKPVVLAGLYFGAKDTIHFSSEWSTERHRLKSNQRGTDLIGGSIWNGDVRILVQNSPARHGVFKFDLVQLTVNKMPYSTISFVEHRVGSTVFSNLIRSLIVPGWGRRKANYGQPNRKFGELLLIGGIAVGTEYYSNKLYNEYEQNPMRTDLFEDSQLYHRISLCTAAFGALDYLYEQGVVLNRSFRNLKLSKETNRKYRNWSLSNFVH